MTEKKIKSPQLWADSTNYYNAIILYPDGSIELFIWGPNYWRTVVKPNLYPAIKLIKELIHEKFIFISDC